MKIAVKPKGSKGCGWKEREKTGGGKGHGGVEKKTLTRTTKDTHVN